MSQMKFSSIPRISYLFRKFQNDKDKRDFVTSGASMGVSAAFSAPMYDCRFIWCIDKILVEVLCLVWKKPVHFGHTP